MQYQVSKGWFLSATCSLTLVLLYFIIYVGGNSSHYLLLLDTLSARMTKCVAVAFTAASASRPLTELTLLCIPVWQPMLLEVQTPILTSSFKVHMTPVISPDWCNTFHLEYRKLLVSQYIDSPSIQLLSSNNLR